jgi:hypothetical protein
MSVISKSTLEAKCNSYLADNTTRSITAEKLREIFTDLIDSASFNETLILSTDPDVNDIPAGTWRVVKNSTTGIMKLWSNDGGTLKNVSIT